MTLIARHFVPRSAVHMFGLLAVLALMVTALFTPWLAPQNPVAQDAQIRLQPPVWIEGGTRAHLLGTDPLGRDVLSRLIYGSRVSLMVAVFSVLIGGLVGITVGVVSGYMGGAYDVVIMGIADAQLAFPFLLLALAVMAALGPGLTNVIIVLSVDGWVVFGRLVRGITLSVRKRDFVEAAQACGASPIRIMRLHILPHVLSPVIVLANLQLGYMVLIEASLSFLGMGINPPAPTWGNMISDGRNYIASDPWLSVLPGIILVLSVLGFTYFGDWLRVRLDPKYRGVSRL